MVNSIHIYPGPNDTPQLGKGRQLVKAMIRTNHVVWGDRQIGKTQALLELLHEQYAEDDMPDIVLCVCAREASIYKQRYHEMFPHDPLPHFFVASEDALQGRSRIFVDGLARFTDPVMDACYQSPVIVRGIA